MGLPRILQNPPESSRILQNLLESFRILSRCFSATSIYASELLAGLELLALRKLREDGNAAS